MLVANVCGVAPTCGTTALPSHVTKSDMAAVGAPALYAGLGFRLRIGRPFEFRHFDALRARRRRAPATAGRHWAAAALPRLP